MDGFGLKGKRMRTGLMAQLQKMVRAGQIIENRRGEFCLLEKLELVSGTVTGHQDGFGFLVRDDGGEDMYLSAREMRAIFHGDRVAVRSVGLDRRGREEAQLVEVLERGTREVAGQFIRERGIGVVIPDNPRVAHRILIAKGEAGAAKHGQIVVAKILDFPTHVEQATGKIVEVIGDPGQKGIATDIAIHAHGIPTDWPKAVRQQAKTFGREVKEEAKQDRIDLRDLNLVTIDGADARDFDDAVYCEPSGNGFRLLVAIADVSHYVEKGSPLDKQAIRRGTSVYFPDRVVPMLPEVLSNGLCSLKPKVDRLCMVCEMRVSADGKVSRSKFYQAVMRSSARLTYGQVNDLLTGKPQKKIPGALRKDIQRLHDVYKLFAKNRGRRGAIELDIPQTRINVDKHGAVTSISATPRNDAHRLIEECMIAANVQAAKFLRKHRVAGLYRVHAKPDPDRFEELRQYLLGLGLKVPHPEHVQPGQLNKLIDRVKDRPDSVAISMALLRSMSHAEYTPKNIGHFGLALDAYAHFTSPIRRYPDLLVHRAIRHILNGGKAGNYGYDLGAMEHLGGVTSEHERRAEDATREVEAWLKCQYMEEKVGEQFDGVVTAVTNFGVFVQLPELQIDGLVHVTSLQHDYYRYDAGSQSLIGDRSGTQYRLGDRLTVVVSRVDLESKRIDFQLAVAGKGRKRKR
jgi:ribonuclease R